MSIASQKSTIKQFSQPSSYTHRHTFKMCNYKKVNIPKEILQISRTILPPSVEIPDVSNMHTHIHTHLKYMISLFQLNFVVFM